MKKVINVGIGGKSFVIDEDAYEKLSKYLDIFKKRVQMGIQTKEVMEDLEDRIAELFGFEVKSTNQVVSIFLVNRVIVQLGLPDGENLNEADFGFDNKTIYASGSQKRLYRDTDDKVIGGVCSGLALYFGFDISLVRIIVFLAILFGGIGIGLYLVFWICVPLAKTAVQKCELRGFPVTAENISKFSNTK